MGTSDDGSTGITWEDGNRWPQLENLQAFDPESMEGDYSDPNHPGCGRHIEVTSATTGEVSGNDAVDGSEPWGPLEATIDGDKIVVDFSPKGGPSDLTGTYEAQPDGTFGITWEDGNTWTQKDSATFGNPTGEFIIFDYLRTAINDDFADYF